MAIADYDTLANAIKRYAARSDSVFSTAIPDFVAIAEDRLYNGHGDIGEPLYSQPVRSSVLEATGTITVADGIGSVPADYLAMRRLSRSGDTVGLTFTPPERLAVDGSGMSSGTPSRYTITGTTLTLIPPGWSGTLAVDYFRRHPAISSSVTTGPLLTAHGIAYLEACLIEAFSFLQEGELAVAHASKLRGIVAGINRTSSELRFSGPLRVRQRVAI